MGTSSAAQTITLTNTGGSSLTTNSVRLVSDVGFNVDSSACNGAMLQPSQGCPLRVTFNPTTTTTVTTSIAIANTGTPASLVVNLSGTGTSQAGPAITLNPTALAFNDTVQGTAGKSKSVVVTNSGTAPLNITAAASSDTVDPSDCRRRSPIKPGGTCTVLVQFHPAQVSSVNANLIVTRNAPTNGIAALSGKGIADKTCVDTDGDGLCDDWETDGVYVKLGTPLLFIDLPNMGADPRHKDVFIHADWMEIDASAPDAHSHKPRLNAMKITIAMYANGPIANPDGKTGITLHVDCGADCVMNPKTGELWGSNSLATNLIEKQALADIDGSDLTIPYDWAPFDTYSNGFNNSGRKPIFHHALFVHDKAKNTTSSGVSRNGATLAEFTKGASDLIVSMGSWGDQHTDLAEAGTLLHELGHNLSLMHGGNQNEGYKPNYLSIMNYLFQTNG